MSGPLSNLKVSFLKQRLAGYFEIDESFVDISAAGSDQENKIYRCELKLETMENSLKTFHLSVYTFYLDAIDGNGFKYEDRYYPYDDLTVFLKKLTAQVDQLDKK